MDYLGLNVIYDATVGLQARSCGSVVEWLKRRARDQHGLGSKITCAILLCLWERHFTAHSPAWWSLQADQMPEAWSSG